MRISQVEGRPIAIKVNGQNLEKAKQFCYLRSLVTEDGRSRTKSSRRYVVPLRLGTLRSVLVPQKMHRSENDQPGAPVCPKMTVCLAAEQQTGQKKRTTWKDIAQNICTSC